MKEQSVAGTGMVLAFGTWFLFAVLAVIFMRPYVMTSAKNPEAIVAALITAFGGIRRPPEWRKLFRYAKQIYWFGYASIFMQALYTVYIVILNAILAGFSDSAVTVLGLYYKLQTFFFIPSMGLQTCIVPVLSFIPVVFSLMTPVFFQAIGNGKISLLLSVMRQILCLIPIFWGLSLLGLFYTWFAFPISEVIVGIVGMVLYRKTLKSWKGMAGCDS